jgi:hypothetical protein
MSRITYGPRDSTKLVILVTGRRGDIPQDREQVFDQVARMIVDANPDTQVCLLALGDGITANPVDYDANGQLGAELVDRLNQNDAQISTLVAETTEAFVNRGGRSLSAAFISASGLAGLRGLREGLERATGELADPPRVALLVPNTRNYERPVPEDYAEAAVAIHGLELVVGSAHEDKIFSHESTVALLHRLGQLSLRKLVSIVDDRSNLPLGMEAHQMAALSMLAHRQLYRHLRLNYTSHHQPNFGQRLATAIPRFIRRFL